MYTMCVYIYIYICHAYRGPGVGLDASVQGVEALLRAR